MTVLSSVVTVTKKSEMEFRIINEQPIYLSYVITMCNDITPALLIKSFLVVQTYWEFV